VNSRTTGVTPPGRRRAGQRGRRYQDPSRDLVAIDSVPWVYLGIYCYADRGSLEPAPLPEQKENKTMQHIIAKLVHQFEQGKLTRRQLIQNLTIAATAGSAASSVASAAPEGKILTATNFNHVSYQVTDYAKTRDFYAGLFGMKVSDDDGKQCRLTFGNNILIVRNRQPAPKVDHIAYTIANWDQEK
jgi:hypothetical protein